MTGENITQEGLNHATVSTAIGEYMATLDPATTKPEEEVYRKLMEEVAKRLEVEPAQLKPYKFLADAALTAFFNTMPQL